jgi:hypothetical protein
MRSPHLLDHRRVLALQALEFLHLLGQVACGGC